MAMTERRLEPRDATGAPATPRGFRPTSRRRARLAAGAAVAAVGIGGNVLLYTSLDDSVEVVQVVATVRQGEQIERADLRIVEVDLDETVPVVPADRIDLLVGQYARTFIAPGTLVVDVMVQPLPLVTAGQGVVAVEIRPTRVPRDLRERSRVFVVVVPDDDDEPLFVAEARVVSRSDTSGDGATGDVLSLSVEVAEADGPIIAAANDVRVVLLDPGVDPVTEVLGQAATPAPLNSTPATSPASPDATTPATTPATTAAGGAGG